MRLIAFLLLAVASLTSLACKKTNQFVESPVKENVETKPSYDLVVAKDGSGDYTSVQAAVDAAPAGKTQAYRILIKSGTYKEVINVPADKTNLFFKGEGTDKTILTFDNYAKRLNSDGKEYGTSGSASVFIKGNNFLAEDLTFENTAGIDAGQALAINITAQRSAFRNCRFLGHQDTYYAGNGTIQYLKDCYLAGTVDFIFGGSMAFFENCTIHSLRSGYLTAASTPQEQAYGYVFQNCKITAKEGLENASVYLGRPWRPYASVTFIQCQMAAHIRPEGWHNWGNADNETTARYAEYQSTGAGYQAGKRVAWSKQLNADEAKNFTKEKILGNWEPFSAEK